MRKLLAGIAAILIIAGSSTGCVVEPAPVSPGASKRTVFVCPKCGATKETSGGAPSCHGQKMVPQ